MAITHIRTAEGPNGPEHFFIKEGRINNFFCVMVHPAKTSIFGEGVFYEFDGDCLLCVGDWGHDHFCHGSMNWIRYSSNNHRYYAFLVFYQSDTDIIQYTGSEIAEIALDVRHVQARVYTAHGDLLCRECGGGDFSEKSLDGLPTEGAHDYGLKNITFPLLHLTDITPRWLRNKWNSIVSEPFRVAPNQQCPLEPASEIFEVYYGEVFELAADVNYSGSGWCKSWADSEESCKSMSGCSGYSVLRREIFPLYDLYGFQGPSSAYPFKLYIDGTYRGQCPGDIALLYV